MGKAWSTVNLLNKEITMTSKQFHITTSEFFNSPIFKNTIGFDTRMARLLDSEFLAKQGGGYPPHNYTHITDADGNVSREITMACAGFTEADIEITVKDGWLIVSGSSGVLAEEAGTTVEFITKGIAERNFEKKWPLDEHVEVTGASLKDGMLKIHLEQHIPEEAKPKTIKISKS
jgi:molecular chaperone IbpA